MTSFRATVEIPASAIDAAVNDRIRELERDRDDARLVAESHRIERDAAQARVKDLESDVCKLSQERDEARAHLYNARQYRDEYLDELEEIRSLLGAGPGVTALEAVKLAQKEAARVEGDEWARAKVLDDIRAALGTDARGPGLVGAVNRLVDRHRELETAIRTLGKALP